MSNHTFQSARGEIDTIQEQTFNLQTQTILSCNLFDKLFIRFDEGILGNKPTKSKIGYASWSGDRMALNNVASSSYGTKCRAVHLQAWINALAIEIARSQQICTSHKQHHNEVILHDELKKLKLPTCRSISI